MKKMLGSILLMILGIIIFFLLLIPGIYCQIYYKIYYNEGYSYTSNLFRSIAICFDQLGNVCYQELWNRVLIIEDGYAFGKFNETLSSVLGKNQVANTLTSTGSWLVNQLNKIEPNHCINSINKNV